MQNNPKTPLTFPCGVTIKNRFMLAPMTNQQSNDDGTLSDDELHWLTMRAKGQFGLVMTCASHVQAIGKGFHGQLGIFDDMHLEGHKKVSANIKQHGGVSVIQLHHAGMRTPQKLITEQPVCPSKMDKHGARALSTTEVKQLRDDFITAAIRAQKSGYDGVEIHGAHGYIITQFLSTEINKRNDDYGGDLKNRSRILFEIVNGVRNACGAKFLLGVRLSPERFGMDINEVKQICQGLVAEGNIDFLDISLWDCFKQPEEEQYKNQSLLQHFTSLNLNNVKLTVAGKISTGKDVHEILNAGVDFVSIGRSAILHHDFPKQVIHNPNFIPMPTPVSKLHLRNQGLGEQFINYMTRWSGFVEEDE